MMSFLCFLRQLLAWLNHMLVPAKSYLNFHIASSTSELESRFEKRKYSSTSILLHKRLSALSQLPNFEATEKIMAPRLVRTTRIAPTALIFKCLHLHLGNLQQTIADSINTAALSHLYQERPSCDTFVTTKWRKCCLSLCLTCIHL